MYSLVHSVLVSLICNAHMQRVQHYLSDKYIYSNPTYGSIYHK
jgi:hypothetical protein